MDSQIKIPLPICKQLAELCAKLLKELKRSQKEQRDCLTTVQETLKSALSTNSESVNVSDNALVNLFNQTYSFLPGDTLKTTIAIFDSLTQVIDSTILRVIDFDRIMPGQIGQQTNNITFLVEVAQKAMNNFGGKFLGTYIPFINKVIERSDDLHAEHLDALRDYLIQLYSTNMLQDMYPILSMVKMISCKYEAKIELKQVPIGYEKYCQDDKEKIYIQDYNQMLHCVAQLLDAVLGGNISVLPQQITTCQLLMDMFYFILEYLPTKVFYDSKAMQSFDSIYKKCILLIINIQHVQTIQRMLHLLENYLKLFLPMLNNQFLFDHFNNFCIRILTTKEIPYFLLKTEIIQHLMRLFSGDQIVDIFKDQEALRTRIPPIWINRILNEGIDEVVLKQYTQMLCRKFMPPGFLLSILFENFDAHQTQPNLVQLIFQTIVALPKDTKFQPSAEEALLEKDNIYSRTYYQKLMEIQQQIQEAAKKGASELLNDVNQFIQYAGYINSQILCSSDDRVFTNLFSGQTYTKYAVRGYSNSAIYCLARLYDSIARVNIIIDKHPFFIADFGINKGESLGQPGQNNEMVEQLLNDQLAAVQLKVKMKEGFDLFDENPLKAIVFFRKLDYNNVKYLIDLVKLTKDEVADFQSEELQAKYIELSTQEPKERTRKASFEETYGYYLTDIVNYIKNYKNGAEAYKNIIQFVLKYKKESDYSVGLSQAAIGELLGGNKVENKCCLYYYAKMFEQENLVNNEKVPFVRALRYFLMNFKIPGEAQVIDRILSMFAAVYSKKSNIAHKVCHALAYATIMLNTDLHNSSVQGGKMTQDVFIKNTKLIDYTNQLTPEFLSEIFNEILVTPFTLGSIEELKFIMMIRDKYIDVKENKPDQQDGNQTPAPQEAEEIKQMPKFVRYATAMQQWYNYGLQCYSERKIHEQQLQFYFDQRLLGQLIQQQGCEPLQVIVDNIRNKDWRPLFIKTFSQLLYTFLNTKTELQSIKFKGDFSVNASCAKYFVTLFIQATQILDISVLQRQNFENVKEQFSEVVLNLQQPNGRFITQQQINLDYQSNLQQDKLARLDRNSTVLLSILLELTNVYVQQNLVDKSKIPQLTFAQYYGNIVINQYVWPIILEIFSRMEYFRIVLTKIVSDQARKPYSNITFDSKKQMANEELLRNMQLAVYKDLDELLGPDVQGQPQYVSQSFRYNTLQMFMFFSCDKSLSEYNQLFTKVHDLQWDVLLPFGRGLANVVTVEARIIIHPSYSNYSSSQLQLLYNTLLFNNKDHFDEFFRITNIHFNELCISQIESISQNAMYSLNQIIQDFVLASRSQNILDVVSPIYDTLLQPIMQSVASMENPKLALLQNIVLSFTRLFVVVDVNEPVQNSILSDFKDVDVPASSYLVNIQNYFKSSKITKSVIYQIFVTVKNIIEQINNYGQQCWKSYDLTNTVVTRAKQLETKHKDYVELCGKLLDMFNASFPRVFGILLWNSTEIVTNDQLVFTDLNYTIAQIYLTALQFFRSVQFLQLQLEIMTEMIINFAQNFIFLMVRTADVQDMTPETSSSKNRFEVVRILGKAINEICWDRRPENRFKNKESVRNMMAKLLNMKIKSDKGQQLFNSILQLLFAQFTELYTQQLLAQVDLNTLPCNNLKAAISTEKDSSGVSSVSFICPQCNLRQGAQLMTQEAADRVTMHCNLELFLDMLQDTQQNLEVKNKIVLSSFCSMLQCINLQKHDSYKAILQYYISNFRTLHENFQQLLQENTPFKFHREYTEVCILFLQESCGTTLELHFNHLIKHLLSHTDYFSQSDFKELILKLIGLYLEYSAKAVTRDEPDAKQVITVQTTKNIVELFVHVISVLNEEGNHHYDNALLACVLQMLLQIPEGVYHEHFRLPLYEPLVSVIANPQIEVRRAIVHLLKLKYPVV